MIKKVVFLFTISLSIVAHAGTSEGLITNVIVQQSGNAAFFKAGDQTGAPSCCTLTGWNGWALNLQTNGGKSALATILYAQANSKKIRVHGLDDCSIWGDREGVNYIEVLDN